MPMRILVSGSLAYDRIMDFNGHFEDHILPDKIHVLNVSFYVEKFKESFGGTSGNIAYNLALLGERPQVLATYGNDFKLYRAWCKKNKIGITYAKQIQKTTTASAYIITDQSDNQIAGFFAGAMRYANGTIPAKVLGHKSIAIVAPGNTADMKKYPLQYKKTKTQYIYDPGQQIPALSKKDLLSGLTGAKVFISNDYELSLVMKKTGLTQKKMLSRVEMIVTTKGGKGSLITTKDKKYRIPPSKPKNTSDPTGAGDAFRAGFIKGLVNGYSLAKAGRLGAVVSVYTVEAYGTQTHRFSWASVRKRYFQNYKKKL